jgi:flagellar protein FlaG
MLIQPVNNPTQSTPPVAQISTDAPKAAANTPDIQAAQSATQDTTQANNHQPPTAEQLKDAVKVINQAMHQANQSLAFSVDSSTKQTIVKLTDTATGEVIRQFPTEQTLAISKSIEQYQRGMLLTQKA